MTFIDGFPQTVSMEQMQAACTALGLPTRHVVGVTMDVRDGVTVILHVADDAGHVLAHHGGPLVTELHLPRASEGTDADAAPR